MLHFDPSAHFRQFAMPTFSLTDTQPILRTLPPKSAFAPCLIVSLYCLDCMFVVDADHISDNQLAIALAANIGGQSSPISSPQNLIAIGEMESPIGWGSWFGVALPVSFISIILIWGLLLLSYHPERCPEGDGEIEIRGIRPTREKFTVEQWWVTFVCIVTIGLWCVEHSIERWVGDMGVIALIPVLAFFSTGVLKKVCGLPCMLVTNSWFFDFYRMISRGLHGQLCSLQWEVSLLEKEFRRLVCLKFYMMLLVNS